MERCKIIKEILIDSIITAILGVIFYCIVESKNNILVALYDGTRNVLSMDIKVIILATYLVSFVKLWIDEKREKNLWSSMCIKVLLSSICYMILVSIFSYSNLILKFSLLIISIIFAQITEKIALKYLCTSSIADEIFKYINIFLVIILIICIVII